MRAIPRPIVATLVATSLTLAASAAARAQPADRQQLYLAPLYREQSPRGAPGPGGMTGPADTGFQLQSLDPTQTMTTVLDFYAAGGGAPVMKTLPPISPLSSYNVYMPQESKLPLSAYASIVKSDRQMTAIVRTQWATTGATALMSSPQPSTELIVPLVMCHYHGQTAYVMLQNTNPNARVEPQVTLFEFGHPSPLLRKDFQIPAGGFLTLDMCDADKVLDGRAGYALVQSSEPIAAQAMVNFETSNAVYGFEGIPTELADTTLYAPLVRNNFYGTTGISVVNPGTTSTAVTVNFAGSMGSCAGWTFTQGPVTVAAGSSILFYQGGTLPGGPFNPLPSSCVAAATIRSRNGGVVAVVNDALGNPAAPTASAAYTAIAAESAARQVAAPLFRKDHLKARLTTGIQAMNTGSAPAHVNLRIALGGGPFVEVISGTACGGRCEATIPPGAAHTWYPGDMAAVPSNRYGSAHLESDQPLAVIISDASANGMADSATYNGLKIDVDVGGGVP